jgi:predicted RNA-binding protein YlqC (UPF0109 family)
MKTNQTEELYRIIAQPLVRYPDELLINSRFTGEACTIVVSCNPKDQGVLIGAGGKMYKACEYLVRVAGRRIGISTRLIIESDFRTTRELRPFVPHENWSKTDNEYLEALLWDVLGYVEDDPVEIQTQNVSKMGTVVLARTSEDLTEQMRVSLETVINAIGKAKGRFVYLEFGNMYESQSENIGPRGASSR